MSLHLRYVFTDKTHCRTFLLSGTPESDNINERPFARVVEGGSGLTYFDREVDFWFTADPEIPGGLITTVLARDADGNVTDSYSDGRWYLLIVLSGERAARWQQAGREKEAIDDQVKRDGNGRKRRTLQDDPKLTQTELDRLYDYQDKPLEQRAVDQKLEVAFGVAGKTIPERVLDANCRLIENVDFPKMMAM